MHFTTNYNLFITASLISVRIDFLLFLKDNLFISYTRFSFFSLCKKQKISWHKKSTKYIGMPLTFHLSDVYKVECLVMSFAYNIIFKNALSHIFTKKLSVSSIESQGSLISLFSNFQIMLKMKIKKMLTKYQSQKSYLWKKMKRGPSK